MGKEKTTQRAESQQTSTVQPFEGEQERIRRLMGQEEAFTTGQTQLTQDLTSLGRALATGGTLPGFYAGLEKGISPETISIASQEAIKDVLPSFQGLGILESGTAVAGAEKAALGQRLNAEQFNLNLLSQLLGYAPTLATTSVGLGQNVSQILNQALAGLRGQTIIGNQLQTTTGMNPFLKSFQQAAGQTLGSPSFTLGGFKF